MKKNESVIKTLRLQVLLARFGIASRRGVVSLIEEGHVRVNDVVIREKGFHIDERRDKVSIDDQPLPINTNRSLRYFVLNKPKGVMTTLQDPHATRTVSDFFKHVDERIFPVGRLDRDTTGLILMTNDGELAFRLTHPKFGVKKRYRVYIRGAIRPSDIKILGEGVLLEGEEQTAPCQIEIITKLPTETVLLVTLHEGKKRQIRRMFRHLNRLVIGLERLSYGPLALGDLPQGAHRELTRQEVEALKKATFLLNSQ